MNITSLTQEVTDDAILNHNSIQPFFFFYFIFFFIQSRYTYSNVNSNIIKHITSIESIPIDFTPSSFVYMEAIPTFN